MNVNLQRSKSPTNNLPRRVVLSVAVMIFLTVLCISSVAAADVPVSAASLGDVGSLDTSLEQDTFISAFPSSSVVNGEPLQIDYMLGGANIPTLLLCYVIGVDYIDCIPITTDGRSTGTKELETYHLPDGTYYILIQHPYDSKFNINIDTLHNRMKTIKATDVDNVLLEEISDITAYESLDDAMSAFEELFDLENVNDIYVKFSFAVENSPSAIPWDGAGTIDSPYLITSVQDLQNLSDRVNSGNTFKGKFFKQTENLDLSSVCGIGIGSWTPIGQFVYYSKEPFTFIYRFSGTYDGNNKTISNLYMDFSNSTFGLFGATEDVNLKNIILENVNITTSDYYQTGGLIGNNYVNTNCEIKNCHVSGNVSGYNSVGGIIGMNRVVNGSCIIMDCSSDCNTSGEFYVGNILGYNAMDGGSCLVASCQATGLINGGKNIGGIIGMSNLKNCLSVVSDCHSSCVITGSEYDEQIGGIVGSNRVSDRGNFVLNNTFADGEVSGFGCVGGLVGQNSAIGGSVSTINFSYATCTIEGMGKGIGGLVGINSADEYGTATIHDCYSTGNVLGCDAVGGLVGYNSAGTGSKATISNSYATGTIIGESSRIGGLVGDSGIWGEDNPQACITNSISMNPSVSGQSSIGRVVGQNIGITNNIYALETMECSANDGFDISFSNATSQRFYTNVLQWDFDNVWMMSPTSKYPVLRMSSAIPDGESDYKLRLYTIESEELVSLEDSSASAKSLFVFAVDKADSENKYNYVKISIRYPDNSISSSFGDIFDSYGLDPSNLNNNNLNFYLGNSPCSTYEVVYPKSGNIAPGDYTAWLSLSDDNTNTPISNEVSFTITNSNQFGFEGQGTKSSPYLIQSADDLVMLGHDLGSYNGIYFSQTGDIDLSGVEMFPIGSLSYNYYITDPESLNENKGWNSESYNKIRVCGDGGSFNGIFNGNGYTISNLNINESLDPDMLSHSLGDKAIGLFGNLGDGAILKNIHLENVNNSHYVGHFNVAGLVGQIWRGLTDGSVLIENCSVNGVVNSSYRGGLLAGTIYAPDGSVIIKNCVVNGTVYAGNCGGLSGYLGGNTSVVKCCVDASVRGSSVGGFVGFCTGGNFVDCLVSGTVSTDGELGYCSAGGITGEGVPRSVENCIVEVDTISSNMESGGITGSGSWFTRDQSIQNVVILSSSITGINSSAIVGYDQSPSSITYENVYLLDSTSIVGSGISNTDITRRITETEAKTQEFYEGIEFDFDRTWEMSSVTGYPVLKKVPSSPGESDDDPVDPTVHEHDGIIFDEWTSTTSLPTTNGNYYLRGDVEIDETWTVPLGETKLDLNGHSITFADYGNSVISVISVERNANLSLYDSVGTGNVTAKSLCYEACLYVDDFGIFNMYEGSITNNHCGGVYVNNLGTFIMYGGNIVGNTDTRLGGGVSNRGTVVMYGGNITDNTGSTGGGVCAIDGTFTMYGGNIVDNHGSGVVNTGGVFILDGGNITGNAAYSGGGVDVSGGTFMIVDGSITGNTAFNGGGVYAGYDGTFTLAGGNITGNTASQYGGGVYFNGKIFKMSGGIVINNDVLEMSNNVYLSNGKYITVDSNGVLDNTKVWITTQNTPTEITPIAFTGVNTNDYSRYFFADNASQCIENIDNVLYLASFNVDEIFNTTEIVNAETTAEMEYQVSSSHVNDVRVPTFVRNGKSVPLDDGVSVLKFVGGVETNLPATVNADGTITVMGDASDADLILISFIGRKIGDVSGDGNPDTLDAAMILKASAEIEALDVKGDFYGDVTNDGQTTTLDAARILQHSADMTDDDYELIG